MSSGREQLFLAIIVFLHLQTRSWQLSIDSDTISAPMVANEGSVESPRPPPKTHGASMDPEVAMTFEMAIL